MTKSPAPALSRGLEIIELLAAEDRPIGFNQLMTKTGLSASSLSRYLSVLVKKGYVQKDGRTGYDLGLQLLALARGNTLWECLLRVTPPVLNEIVSKFGVTCIVVGFTGRQMIVLDKLLCPNNVSMQEVGEVKTDYLWVPWGAMFLAHVSDREREYMLGHMELPDNAVGRPMTEDELAERMRMAVSLGYVDDRGTQIRRIRRLATPVYGPQDQLVAALAVASFTTLLEAGLVEELIAWLKDQAAHLSSLLKAEG